MIANPRTDGYGMTPLCKLVWALGCPPGRDMQYPESFLGVLLVVTGGFDWHSLAAVGTLGLVVSIS